ncbi:MAG: SDR family NAD(P)-dependent oxidoreductase [Nakamurella sp.]
MTIATAGAAAVVRRRGAARSVETNDLNGRTAVVTGAGSGIGRSIATLLAERGATVHLADQDAESVASVVTNICQAGGNAVPHTVDVTDAAAVERLADVVFAAGAVDLLFNNAGIGHGGNLIDTTLEDWRRVVDVNLMGVVHGLHAFLPRMLEQEGISHIVNTASMAGLVPVPGLTAYSATKSAVVGLTDALDMELIGTRVRVSALCPGIINTAIVKSSTARGAWAERQEQTAAFYAKRGTSPDVVARQTLAAVRRGLRVVPTPRYQVVPHWLLKRVSPRAGRAVSTLTARLVTKAR